MGVRSPARPREGIRIRPATPGHMEGDVTTVSLKGQRLDAFPWPGGRSDPHVPKPSFGLVSGWFCFQGLDRASSPPKPGLLAWAAPNGPVLAIFGWTTVSQRLGGRRVLLSARARVGQASRRAAGQPANRWPLRETVVTSPSLWPGVAGRIRTPSRGRAGDLTPMSLSHLSV